MDLEILLKKTKATSDRFKRNREPVYVATDDRPYEMPSQQKNDKKNISNKAKQTENKLETNLGQTEDKVRTKLGQSEDKLGTNLGQSEDKLRTELRTQLRTNLGQSEDKLGTKLGQSEDKWDTSISPYFGFQSLIGLQRKLAVFIYQQCQLNRDKVTPPLSIENIATACNTTILSARKTIQRLENKSLLMRKYFKNGRGGWTQYELSKDAYQELLHSLNYNQIKENLGQSEDKLRTKLGQSEDKLETQLRTELRTSAPSSSSSNNINIITTTTKPPEEWLNIDLEEASQFGLTQSHLLQLYRTGNYEPKIVEDSIRHFCFDLAHNEKAKSIKTNPLGYFMGILKRVGVYAAPENYESPKDRALRNYFEREKALQEKKALIEKELFNLEFEKWLSQLSENEKNEIIPGETKKLNLAAPKMAALRMHFEKVFWQSIKNETLNKIFKETGNGN